jgi:hypothetical protein
MAAGVVIAAGLAAGAAFTFGQSSPSTDALRGCVDRKSGALRMTPPGRKCTRRERKVTWNAPGRAGPAGAAGAAGAQGAGGPQGGAGSDGAPGQPGARGDRGAFDFDDLDGLPCNDGSPGTTDVTYDSQGFAVITC